MILTQLNDSYLDRSLTNYSHSNDMLSNNYNNNNNNNPEGRDLDNLYSDACNDSL